MGIIRVEEWMGYKIRFVELDGEWLAILKDICDALKLRTDKVSKRLEPDMMTRVKVDISNHPSRGIRSKGDNKTRWMLAINEIGIYEALFASRKLEARKFRRWSAGVLKKLRANVGLKQYEVMRMTELGIQDEIDHLLDGIFYDEESGKLMRSVTIPGGDVEQISIE